MVEGKFLDIIDVVVDGEEISLSLWRNPKTGGLTALDTMELPASNRFFYDAYTGEQVIVADTFSGLPK